MAPRKPSKGAASKSTPKKRVAANGFRLPDPIPAGVVIKDITKKEWVLGKSIGQGGFGEIYLASNDPSRAVNDTDKYVVKVEPHSNGPLFTEMHCYMRIAKPDLIDAWMKQHKLKRFGMPKYLGSGSFEYKNQKYRFMVMERFGSDLQKILEQHNRKFSFKTVYQVGLEILDVLEYIHDKGYIHADIKASNLLRGFQKGTEDQVFLVDYGLACRYTIDGVHKEYKYDGRKAHDGTIEFTSRDAHIGAHSRRGDLEILGYNLTQWLCSKLPWEDNLSDCDCVAKQKRWYMDNVDKFIDKCFPDVTPPGLQDYLTYVASLTFDEAPDYEKCRNILRAGLIERGYKDDGKLVFMSATPKPASRKPKSRINNKVRKSSSTDVEGLNQSVDMFLDSDEGDEVLQSKEEVSPLKKRARGAVKKLSPAKRSIAKKAVVKKTKVALETEKKRPRRAATSSSSAATDDVDDDDDEVISIESSVSDDFEEKENKGRRANSQQKRSKVVVPVAKGSRLGSARVRARTGVLDSSAELISPPKKAALLKAKERVEVRKKGQVLPLSPKLTPEQLAAAAGIVNPTPAMLELFAKRSAKASAGKAKK